MPARGSHASIKTTHEDQAYRVRGQLMSAAAFMRIKKLRGAGIITAAARHNRRVIQKEMGAGGSINPTQSHLNETLRGPPTADGVGQLAKDLMSAAGINKLRKDAVLGLEVVFSLAPGSEMDDRVYFSACEVWAAATFGGKQNILSVDIHRDEAAPHCHILILPLVSNRMNGSDMFGSRQRLLAMQKDFFDVVACRYGLRKAPRRLAGASKYAAAKVVLQRLRETSDAALKSIVWSTLRDAIEQDPAPFLVALGIEMDVPTKKLRTIAQIFTSPGKGSANDAMPIGFDGSENDRTLCSVAFPKNYRSFPARCIVPAASPDLVANDHAWLNVGPCMAPGSVVIAQSMLQGSLQ